MSETEREPRGNHVECARCGWEASGAPCGPIVELLAHRMAAHGPAVQAYVEAPVYRWRFCRACQRDERREVGALDACVRGRRVG